MASAGIHPPQRAVIEQLKDEVSIRIKYEPIQPMDQSKEPTSAFGLL